MKGDFTSEIGRFYSHDVRNNHLLGGLGRNSADREVKALFQIDVV